MTLVELNLIKNIVGKYLNYDFNNKRKNKKRIREYVEARMIYFYLCRQLSHMSLADIGATIKPVKDHSTVLHGCRTMDGLIKFDKKISFIYQDLYNIVGKSLTDLRDKGEDMLSYEEQILRIQELEQQNEKILKENIKILKRLDDFEKVLYRHKKYLREQGYMVEKSKTFKILETNAI